MHSRLSKSSLWFYVPTIILGGFLIGIVFYENFKTGYQIGLNTPEPVGGRHVAAVVDLRALAKDPSLANKGKGLYQINCASCHGVEGEGDGPRAAGLNPPPRKYKTEEFKYGNDVHSIFTTLTQGSPGTSMPAFGLLPPEDRMAMAHYIRTLVPSPTATSDEIVAKFPEVPAGAQVVASGTAPATPQKSDSGRIPIQFAIQRYATATPAGMTTTNPDWNLEGANIYMNRCASCHGSTGQGATESYISVAPYRYNPTRSLANPSAAWYNNPELFANIVIHGLPGRVMPGNATLTKEQIEDLHVFVRSLAGTR